MVDLSAAGTFPVIKSIAATTNTTEIKIPTRARHVTIATETGIVYFAYTGEDNGTISNDRLFVTNYGMVEQKLGRGKNRPDSIFVAMKNTTGTILVSFEDE